MRAWKLPGSASTVASVWPSASAGAWLAATISATLRPHGVGLQRRADELRHAVALLNLLEPAGHLLAQCAGGVLAQRGQQAVVGLEQEAHRL